MTTLLASENNHFYAAPNANYSSDSHGLITVTDATDMAWLIARGAKIIEVGSPDPAQFPNRSCVGWRSGAGFLGTMTSPAYDGKTMQTRLTAEAPFIACRVIIRNNEATSYTLDACAVAVSAVDQTNPTTGAAGWVQVTFGGSASPTIPARTAANRPSVTVSDWVNIQSIARTDSGTLPLIYVRGYNATGPKSGYVSTGNPANWNNDAGRIFKADAATGNFVTASQASFVGDGGTFSTFIAEVEVIHDRSVLTVLALGDSITQGDDGSNTLRAPVHYAVAALSTTARPIVLANQGFSNMTTSNFVDRLSDLITSGRKPHVCVYSAWSPNDITGGTVSATEINLMKFNLAKAIQLCQANGIYIIVSTAIPANYTAGNDAFRQSFNTYIRTLATQGITVCDYDLLVSDGAAAARIIAPAYTDTTGNIHPNTAGYTAMGRGPLATCLQAVIPAYFVS